MAEGKEICCCPAYSWTRVIAWIQIIYFAFGLSVLSFYLTLYYFDQNMFAQAWEHLYRSYDQFEMVGEEALLTFYVHPVATIMMVGVVIIIHIIMGIVLLRGAHKKNLDYLMAWTIYAIICVILTFVQLRTVSGQFMSIVLVILTIAVYTIEILIVHRFKKEIQDGVYTNDRGRRLLTSNQNYVITDAPYQPNEKQTIGQNYDYGYDKV